MDLYCILLSNFYGIHCTVIISCVNSNWACQWEMMHFDPTELIPLLYFYLWGRQLYSCTVLRLNLYQPHAHLQSSQTSEKPLCGSCEPQKVVVVPALAAGHCF